MPRPRRSAQPPEGPAAPPGPAEPASAHEGPAVPPCAPLDAEAPPPEEPFGLVSLAELDAFGSVEADDGLGPTPEERARMRGSEVPRTRSRQWLSYQDSGLDPLGRYLELLAFTTRAVLLPAEGVEDSMREACFDMRLAAMTVGSVARALDMPDGRNSEGALPPDVLRGKASGRAFAIRNTETLEHVSDILSVLSDAFERACTADEQARKAAQRTIRSLANVANASVESPLRKPSTFRKLLSEQFKNLPEAIRNQHGDVAFSAIANAIGLYGFKGVRRGRVSTPKLAEALRARFQDYDLSDAPEGSRSLQANLDRAIKEALRIAGASSSDIDAFLKNAQRKQEERSRPPQEGAVPAPRRRPKWDA